jgi:hypothetical protein
LRWFRVLLAGLLVATGCARIDEVQTAIVVEVRPTLPLDCVTVLVTPAQGGPKGVDVATPTWMDPADAEPIRVAIYPGGDLDGPLLAEAYGRRGGCQGPVVADLGSRSPPTVDFIEDEVRVVTLTLYVIGIDRDGDGYADHEDCDDDDPLTHPGAPPTCDGTDRGCDGAPDVGCPCTAGTERPCYPLGLDHPSLAVDEAPCRAGVQRCEGGLWGLCEGHVLPRPEQCDDVDHACDGEPWPAHCPCRDGETRSCFTLGPYEMAGVGQCRAGLQTCERGAWGACEGQVGPSPEVCDGTDNSCDGIVDTPWLLPREPCPLTRGVCALASRPCIDGVLAECTEAVYAEATGGAYDPTGDRCEGLDNDCDGRIDFGCPCNPEVHSTRLCYGHGLGLDDPSLGVGECRAGIQRCIDPGDDARPEWGPCEGDVGPEPEVCDGLDTSCSGVADDLPEIGQPCEADAYGICIAGSIRCQPDDGGLVCTPGEPAPQDTLCDGVDATCQAPNDDAIAYCGTGRLCCDAACRLHLVDVEHCGTCHNRCPEDGGPCRVAACADGQCTYDDLPDHLPCPELDDDNPCTYRACRRGTCAEQTFPDGTACDYEDGTVCVSGTCVRRCSIDGTIYTEGVRQPGNPCRACRPGVDPFGWSPVTDGTQCDGDLSNPCTSGACRSGTCADEPVADGTVCDDGVCLTGACSDGCWIDGGFVAGGETRPDEACSGCLPGTDALGWSSMPAGTDCHGGHACTAEAVCDGSGTCELTAEAPGLACFEGSAAGVCTDAETCTPGCWIDGGFVAPGAGDAENPCHVCDPEASISDWSARPPGTDCGEGAVCDGSASCVEGCWIDDAHHAPGSPNPTEPCLVCEPEADTGAWSPSAPGTACDGPDGAGFCDAAGDCLRACWIDDTLHLPGETNPANGCEICDPDESQEAWTDAAPGDACDDTSVCDANLDCREGCWIDGAFYEPGERLDNGCSACDPSVDRFAWSDAEDGLSCSPPGGGTCQGGECVN